REVLRLLLVAGDDDPFGGLDGDRGELPRRREPEAVLPVGVDVGGGRGERRSGEGEHEDGRAHGGGPPLRLRSVPSTPRGGGRRFSGAGPPRRTAASPPGGGPPPCPGR